MNHLNESYICVHKFHKIDFSLFSVFRTTFFVFVVVVVVGKKHLFSLGFCVLFVEATNRKTVFIDFGINFMWNSRTINVMKVHWFHFSIYCIFYGHELSLKVVKKTHLKLFDFLCYNNACVNIILFIDLRINKKKKTGEWRWDIKSLNKYLIFRSSPFLSLTLKH